MIYLNSIQKSFLIDQTIQDVEVEFINGAVIGGFIDLQGLGEIADSYLKAGAILVEKSKNDREHAYEIAYPIIFIYRHAVELKLKSILNDFKKGHSNLMEYTDYFLPTKLQKDLNKRISDFIKIDSQSTRFRFGSKPQNEYLIELSQLKNVVEEVFLVINRIKIFKSKEDLSQ